MSNRIGQIEEYVCREDFIEFIPDKNRLGSINLLTGEINTMFTDDFGNHYAIDVYGCHDLRFLVTFALWRYKVEEYLREEVYGE